MIIISGSAFSVLQRLITSDKISSCCYQNYCKFWKGVGSRGGGQRSRRGRVHSYTGVRLSLQALAFQWVIKPLNWVLIFEGFWTCVFLWVSNLPEVVLWCKLLLQIVLLCAHYSLSRFNLSGMFHSIKHAKACSVHLVRGFPWWLLMVAFVLVSKNIVCLFITPLRYRFESHQQNKMGALLDSVLVTRLD